MTTISITPSTAIDRARGAEVFERIVLGIDGMDYGLVRDLMAAGRMPNFSALARSKINGSTKANSSPSWAPPDRAKAPSCRWPDCSTFRLPATC